MNQALIFCFQNAKATGALGVTADYCSQGGWLGGVEYRQQHCSRGTGGLCLWIFKNLEDGTITRTLRKVEIWECGITNRGMWTLPTLVRTEGFLPL